MSAISPHGLRDGVFDSQSLFRVAMNALARPGSPSDLAAAPCGPTPLMAGAAGLALTLCDYETPFWMDAGFSRGDAANYVRFHTGAPCVASAAAATFAFVSEPERLLDLSLFSMGTLEGPDLAATLIVQLSQLDAGDMQLGGRLRLSGPGIVGSSQMFVAPSALPFFQQLQQTRQLLPRGLDVFLVKDKMVVGLPRSTTIEM